MSQRPGTAVVGLMLRSDWLASDRVSQDGFEADVIDIGIRLVPPCLQGCAGQSSPAAYLMAGGTTLSGALR